MKNFILLLSIFLSLNVIPQNVIAFDNMETFTWSGDWYFYNYSNFFTDISVSPPASAVHYGVGDGNSGIEQDWYVLPNITGLNPAYTYKVKFRLASTLLTNGTAGTRGVDGNDYIEVQLSTNGGVSYSSEIRVRGFSNAQWDYSATGVAAKTANGTLTTFTTPNGNNYALRPGGYSTVELTLPVGSTQCAVDIYNRVNSAGEDFWIDNIELIEFPNTPLPISLLSFRGISQQNQNLIEWTTASEQNNSHFILEQSTNGLFNETSVINMQHGGGNSSTPLHYSFTVKNPEPTINYYKLTQVDFNGAGKESFIISVNNRDAKYIVKSINMVGQEVNENYPGLIIHQYNDGTITKTYN